MNDYIYIVFEIWFYIHSLSKWCYTLFMLLLFDYYSFSASSSSIYYSFYTSFFILFILLFSYCFSYKFYQSILKFLSFSSFSFSSSEPDNSPFKFFVSCICIILSSFINFYYNILVPSSNIEWVFNISSLLFIYFSSNN